MKNSSKSKSALVAFLAFIQLLSAQAAKPVSDDLEKHFINPPHPAKPWVYWINMDGHFTKEGITASQEYREETAGSHGGLYRTELRQLGDGRQELDSRLP